MFRRLPVGPRDAALIFTLAAALVVASCGGNSEESPVQETDAQTSIAPIPSEGPAVVPNPQLLVLQQEDVPTGFVVTEKSRLDNRTAARSSLDPDRQLLNYERWGRVDGYEVTFSNGDDEQITSLAATYRTANGMREAFQNFVETIRDDLEDAFKESGFEIESIEIVKDILGPELGDERFIIRAKLSIMVLGSRESVSLLRVSWRTHNVGSTIQWVSSSLGILTSDALSLAAAQDSRIRISLSNANS